MKKQTLILALLTASNLAYSGINVNYQKSDVDNAIMEQRDGMRNEQAINDAESRSEWVGVGQTYTSNNTRMTQRGARNSEMYLNKARVSGKTLVHQSTDIKKLQTRQQGGSGNKMAVNKLIVD